jgi:hypothetical protein
MLGNVFNLHPKTTYKSECNYIWRIDNSHLKNDLLSKDLVIKDLKQKIRTRLLPGDSNKVLVEKTAANSLRLPFILEIFPEAKIIHIVRDGRDVALSARKKWKGNLSEFERNKLGYEDERKSIISRLWKRFSSGDIPATELPNYFFKGLELIKSHLGLAKSGIWGPRFPGIEDLYKTHSLLEVCAWQWFYSVQGVLNFHANNPSVPYYTIKYEDLTANPAQELAAIFNFCNLDSPSNMREIEVSIKAGNCFKWREQLARSEINQIQNISAYLLKNFNYDLD